jgi:hypothetical protein
MPMMREQITAHIRPTTRKLAKTRAAEMERSLSNYIEFLIEEDVSRQNGSGHNPRDVLDTAAFARKVIAANNGLFRSLAK